jgi:hypothetical protein
VSTFVQFSSGTKISLFSNKCDLESQRQVPKEEAEKYAEKRHALYIETR